MLSCDVIGIGNETCVDKTAVSEEGKLWKKHIENTKKYSMYIFFLIATKKLYCTGFRVRCEERLMGHVR
jgi:hypothetical protein